MEHGPFEDVFPIKNGDIPASYVNLPEGNKFFIHFHLAKLARDLTRVLGPQKEANRKGNPQKFRKIPVDEILFHLARFSWWDNFGNPRKIDEQHTVERSGSRPFKRRSVGGRAEKKGADVFGRVLPPKTDSVNGKSPFLIGDISSNGCFSIVMLYSFPGCLFPPKGLSLIQRLPRRAILWFVTRGFFWLIQWIVHTCVRMKKRVQHCWPPHPPPQKNGGISYHFQSWNDPQDTSTSSPTGPLPLEGLVCIFCLTAARSCSYIEKKTNPLWLCAILGVGYSAKNQPYVTLSCS